MKNISQVLFFLIVLILASSCSNYGSSNPAESQLPQSDFHSDSPRTFLGFYTLHLDPQNQEYSIEPNREIASHMNATGYLLSWPCNDCLKIQNLNFLPGNQVECDIEVTHPINNPVFTVFDLRVIAIFPQNLSFGGIGVSTALVNRDGLTAIWDNPGIPGYINGYIAYNKTENRRPFGPGDVFSEYFLIQLPGGPISYDIAVDAGWAPNDGVNFPIEMNSFEVINLSGQISSGLTDAGGLAELSVNMYDYQGTNTIESATAFCNDLFNAPVPLVYESGDGNNAVYSASITNAKNAAPGSYNVLVEVKDNENINYPQEISSYIVLSADVVSGHVEITLSEDDAYKTPGYLYTFSSYGGPADHNVIDYFDPDGPWDFTSINYTETAYRKMWHPDDPEVATFSGNFPGAEHFLNDYGDFGYDTGYYYQPEIHDYANNRVLMLGFYEEEHFQGSIVFDSPNDGFPYPVNINTSYQRHFQSGMYLQFDYDVQAIGEGLCTIPLDGGTTRNTLLVRTIYHAEIIFPVVAAIHYEWFDDDGNLIAMVVAPNLAGENVLWNEDTNEITYGGIMALNEFSN